LQAEVVDAQTTFFLVLQLAGAIPNNRPGRWQAVPSRLNECPDPTLNLRDLTSTRSARRLHIGWLDGNPGKRLRFPDRRGYSLLSQSYYAMWSADPRRHFPLASTEAVVWARRPRARRLWAEEGSACRRDVQLLFVHESARRSAARPAVGLTSIVVQYRADAAVLRELRIAVVAEQV
jgi:hypothetical protein